MPLYLDQCMIQTSPLGILVSILCYSLPALVWRLMYGKENLEFHEETAVSFWFGKGRLTILSMTIVFDVARLVYECIFQNVFAILITMRILACTYQLYDHYWMQKNWIEFFIHGKKRAFLWIRFYASAILLLLYATLDEVQIGIVGHYGIWFHQYVITTFFYAAMLASFLFWFLWFLVSFSKSGDNRSWWRRDWLIDRPRFLRYRFNCLRNITMSLIPFFIVIGVFANIIDDNVSDDLFNNTMQWRYPFMLAGDLVTPSSSNFDHILTRHTLSGSISIQGLLVPMAWAIQRFLVLPYDRLMIHRDTTVPMAGDLPVANDVIAGDGDVVEGNASHISRRLVDEALLTNRSTPRTMPWIPNTKTSGNKVHIGTPESLDCTMTNSILLVQPQLSQQTPAQPSPLMGILISISRTNSHNALAVDQVHEAHQEDSVTASAHTTSSSNTVSPFHGSGHSISVPPSNPPMPTLAEDNHNPSSSPVDAINKLRHRLDLVLFGSQVEVKHYPSAPRVRIPTPTLSHAVH